MTQYFYLDNGAQKGPFSLEDLKVQNIKPETMVWHSQLPEWIEAKNEPSISKLFIVTAPVAPISTASPGAPVSRENFSNPAAPKSNWVQHYSQEQKRNYWYNNATQESTWTQPADYVAPTQSTNYVYGNTNSGILDNPNGHEILSEANTAKLIGIIAMSTSFLILPGLIMGPIALSKHRKVKKIYLTDPMRYNKSLKVARLGNIFGWVGMGIAAYILFSGIPAILDEMF